MITAFFLRIYSFTLNTEETVYFGVKEVAVLFLMSCYEDFVGFTVELVVNIMWDVLKIVLVF